MRFLPALIMIALLWTARALAQPLAGADDPAFTEAFSRLLRTNDPASITALRDLAAEGNLAALVALPVAEIWVPPQGSFAARRALRQIGGQAIEDLAANADPSASLWHGGTINTDLRAVLDRGLGLYRLGEARKADVLVAAAFNHDPDMALPPDFADLPVDPRLLSSILELQLYHHDPSLSALQDAIDRDQIGGWMTLAEIGRRDLLGHGKAVVDEIKLPNDAGTRIADGLRSRDLMAQHPPPVPAPTVASAMETLMPSPQFAPVRDYCAARCPDTTLKCEAAFVTLLGHPDEAMAAATPLHSVLAEAEFFASPRGAQVLLGSAMQHWQDRHWETGFTGDLTDNPAYLAARVVDVCFAQGALQSIKPLPLSD